MATVMIERSNEMNNRLRDYGVYIDGEKVGVIANGETKEFEIGFGRHLIYCKIDWCSSPQISFEATDDELKIFKVGGFKNGNWMVPAAIAVIIISYVLQYLEVKIFYLAVLIIPFFLLLVYYLTIGRKKYLTLIQV